MEPACFSGKNVYQGFENKTIVDKKAALPWKSGNSG